MTVEPHRGVVVALVGATGTGKSSLALEIARAIGGEIVNCDALQIYRGLDIGTAKPSTEVRSKIPHHLYDIRDPHQRFSAGEYASDATETLDQLTQRSHAILVGGTGLYYRALTRGIAAIPPIPDHVRAAVRGSASEAGPASTHELLREKDPVMAARIQPTDTQRTLRALEVLAATGRSQSAWIAEQQTPVHPWQLVPFLLTLERSLLYDQLELRTQAMLAGGWITEVQALLESGVQSSAPAFQAIGYRQIVDLLAGRISSVETLDRILLATRRYAKRQSTWFRQEPGLKSIDALKPSPVIDGLVDLLSFHPFSSGGSQ